MLFACAIVLLLALLALRSPRNRVIVLLACRRTYRYVLFLGAPPAVVAAPVAYYDVDAEAPPDDEDDNPVARRGPKED